MKLPVLSGVVRRRILANYRMDPEVAARWVPAPLRPKLQGGHAIAGVCLIRLEDIKPQGLPCLPGITSENAAHRIAVEWDDAEGRTREGVFIERRDSDSWLNQLAGGRIFPGRHGAARFEVNDDGARIGFRMRGEEGLAIAVDGVQTDTLPSSSVFADLREASAFFEGGSFGYSRTDDPSRLDGMQLVTGHVDRRRALARTPRGLVLRRWRPLPARQRRDRSRARHARHRPPLGLAARPRMPLRDPELMRGGGRAPTTRVAEAPIRATRPLGARDRADERVGV